MAINTLGLNLSATVLVGDQPMSIQERVDKIIRMANQYRGIQSAKRVSKPLTDGPYAGREATRITMRGTEKAIRHMQEVIDISGLELTDNETHDHDRCIANAKAMGVPESWAHRPETYLSM